MSQTNYIALVLLVAFLMFITARGELPKYMQVIGL